ncbi:MAG: retropepsin-like domain-containing protein [Parcubacteria group bacterium]|nr:retropepsin-like domain-containing protein [Parcubacteria group bacterium]
MKKAFPYFKKGSQHFPIVPVTLTRGNNRITIEALIDSGASFSVFRPEVAEYLGIPITNGARIQLSGIGGKITGYLHTLTVQFGSKKFPCKIIFSPEFNVSFNLLGRDNFFVPFIISFKEKTRQIVIES